MISLKLIVTLAVVFVGSLSGFALNALILVVNLIDWIKDRNLPPSDQIHVALGLVNIILQCVLTVQSTLFVTFLYTDYIKQVFLSAFVLLPFLIYLNFWLNAWLCLHYVTSVASFRHRLFVWLKGNISALCPKFMLVSAVGSFIISLPYFWNAAINVQPDSYQNVTGNPFYIIARVHVNPVYQLIVAFLGNFFPFVLSSICLGHTLAPIFRHVWRIKRNDAGLSCPNLQAHIRASKTMTLLLLLYVGYYIAQVLHLICTYSLDDKATMISWFLVILFPSFESFVVIQSRSKLRKVFQRKRCGFGVDVRG